MTCQRYASASSRNLRRLNKNAAKGGDVSMHATCFGAEGHTPGVGGEREGAGCECAKVAVVSASAPPKKKEQMHSYMEMLQLEVVWGVWVQNLCVRERESA